MTFVNPNSISFPADRVKKMLDMTNSLCAMKPDKRAEYIEAGRGETWGHRAVLKALREPVGNKCWYTEVKLEGADANVDHLRPKGRVREVDSDLMNTGKTCDGYWWLAFEPLNFRLASVHANQRRVDEDTSGGKWDYFPVRSPRANALTLWRLIEEDILALDPCSASDVRLLCFDLDGNPCATSTASADIQRVRTTIWLYHLNKAELQAARRAHVQDLQKDLSKADAAFKIWQSNFRDIRAKNNFDQKLAEIQNVTSDKAEFAGAKLSALRMLAGQYTWIGDYLL
jgi:hypothetical protein